MMTSRENDLLWAKIQPDRGNLGCLPFTKTTRLEISGINIKQLNPTSRERESL